jgi:hypothetical protein
VAIFVDEALGDYGDIAKARDQAKAADMAPDKLLAWMDDIDLSKQLYGGWAELGKFAAGVWAGRPLPELNSDLRQAYAAAKATRDRALEFETLKAAHELAPIMASNWTIASRHGGAAPQIDEPFNPLPSGSPARTMEARLWLASLPECTEKALKVYTSTEMAWMQAEIKSLANPTLPQAFQALADYYNSRLPRERSVLTEGALTTMEGDLQYTIAAAAVRARNLAEARDRLRMLKSLESAAGEGLGPSGHIQALVASLEEQIPAGADSPKVRR